MGQLLTLPTEPRFLRAYQNYTRETLLGVVWRQRLKQKTRLRLQELGFFIQLVLTVVLSSKPKTARLSLTYRLKAKSRFARVMLFLLLIFSVFSLLTTVIFFAPAIYYHFVPAEEVVLEPDKPASVIGGNYQAGADATVRETYQPPYDETLPDGDWLVIDQIGVRTPLRVTEDPSQAIAKGVWMAFDYGRPGDQGKPIILAAHRFGYKWWWQNDYWKKNSFYKLPETKAGTIIKIISDHRQWEYEVYKAEEGDEITDYDADLILYTCKFLNSPVRYIRYARLINPNTDTQS